MTFTTINIFFSSLKFRQFSFELDDKKSFYYRTDENLFPVLLKIYSWNHHYILLPVTSGWGWKFPSNFPFFLLWISLLVAGFAGHVNFDHLCTPRTEWCIYISVVMRFLECKWSLNASHPFEWNFCTFLVGFYRFCDVLWMRMREFLIHQVLHVILTRDLSRVTENR